jgi:hypothetical protein
MFPILLNQCHQVATTVSWHSILQGTFFKHAERELLVDKIAGLLLAGNKKDGSSGKRCPDAYLMKIGKLFPPCQMFASYTQL